MNQKKGTTVTYGVRESDGSIVSEKRSNKVLAAAGVAEGVERREPAKGNGIRPPGDRSQNRVSLQESLDRIRQFTVRRKGEPLVNLWHHVYDVKRLECAYRAISRGASAGVDGLDWQTYGKGLQSRLEDLSGRLKRGAYRAKAIKRVFIPKAGGRQRPIGIPSIEDKIVQRATTEVMNAVYEQEFKGFSYGFRPGRNQHNALDALSVALETRKISYVLDADISAFFDGLDHEWLIKFIRHRIRDERLIRHVRKWLKAGVLEDDILQRNDVGTPQGGSISPLLANIYLHYVLDLWVDSWRKHRARGQVIIVRYADDFIVGFQYREDAQRFHEQLKIRLGKFNLKLHPQKTRLLEFGRFAQRDRRRKGLGKPQTFDFLGFTHSCSKTRKGRFALRRQTIAKRMRSKLKQIRKALKRRMHDTLYETGKWLKSVLTGYYRYHAVPRNLPILKRFRWEIRKAWCRFIRRRSHKHRYTWKRMDRLVKRWLPNPKVMHPYPAQRLRVNT